MPENNLDDKYICCHCGELLPSRNYYKNNSDVFFAIKHLPICKACLNKLYVLYLVQYGSSQMAMQRICMTFNIYYNDKLFMACDDDKDSILGNYIKKLNINQHRNKDFGTTIQEGFSFGEHKIEDGKEETIDEKLTSKWGNGFTKQDYDTLEEHYDQLKKNNPNTNNNQEIFIYSLCHLNMLMMRALRAGDLDDYAKANEQYSKTFTKAGLKTAQEVDMGEDDCWGEWTRRIEQYTPSEYYKNKSLFKDHDGLGDYLTRFVLRPLKNLQFGTAERDYEYCVKDGDEEDDDSEPT